MTQKSSCQINIILALALFLGQPIINTMSAEAKEPEDLTLWFAQMAAYNSPPMSDPAGSHGAAGLWFAGGMSRYPQSSDSAIAREEMGENSDSEAAASRLWLVKGLPLPVDLMFTGGRDRQDAYTQATVAAQWNVFEGLGLPALAVRLSTGGLFGLQQSWAQTQTFGIHLSQNIGPYCSIFGSTSYARHKLAYHVPPAASGSFLSQSLPGAAYTTTLEQRPMTIGARLKILPPFVGLTLEFTYVEGVLLNSSAALGFGV